MGEMEDKLNTILGNPQLMQQIMSMAQSLGSAAPETAPPPKQEVPPIMPDMDPAMIGKIMNLAGKTNIDRNQKALLCALEPYLSSFRLHKLEKAMRAARLASAASGLIPFLSGR
ncbi:MAG: hypothetical protein IKT52_06455 [Oscillospiraceae bacterium]|nr:hypothetical protein [Oscillospiraceae bacterium]